MNGEDHVQRGPYQVKVYQREQLLARVNAMRELPRLNELTAHQLEAKLSILERHYDNFGQLQTELELLDDRELTNPNRELFEESFCAAKALIIERLHATQPSRQNSLLHSTLLPTSPNNVTAMTSLKRFHLPKIQLTKFNGEHRHWIDFYNTFCVLVHGNAELTNIEKFQYLRSCLVDNAARLIQSLEVTEDNYARALELLRSRYGNKRLTLQAHLSHIFELKAAVKPTASALREFIDVVNTNFRAMQSLATSQQISEGILLHLIVSKLDPQSKAKWEEEVTKSFDTISTSTSLQLPTWDSLSKFLERQCQIAEILESGQPDNNKEKASSTSKTYKGKRDSKTAFVVSNQSACVFCNASPIHSAFKCESFNAMDPMARYNCVKRLNLCLNCLKGGHKSSDCPSKHSCRSCSVKHHSLLHRQASTEVPPAPENPERAVLLSSSALQVSNVVGDVILGTALIHVSNFHGINVPARALLDSCSQLHFITERLAQHLRVQRKGVHINVSGIGNGTTKGQHICSIKLESRHSDYSVIIEAVIIPTITTYQPSHRIDTSKLQIPSNVLIADPTFDKPGPIDLLIGAGLFFDILGKAKISLNGPVLQDTQFGWIVAGSVYSGQKPVSASSQLASSYQSLVVVSSELQLDRMLERFWEIDDLSAHQTVDRTADEIACENFFARTTSRCSETNKFIVRLPFRDDPSGLGDSEVSARKRMWSLEKKFDRDSKLHENYAQFIKEYIDMKHMAPISHTEVNNHRVNYIPHHGVVKLDSSTTKLRVVFDASCKTASAKSLNDMLLVGPTLQDTIFTILCRFRRHKYVIIADIAKMYRQVWIDKRDTKWQCIFWRTAPDQPMQTYELQTVTYGTSSAPYLAVKCLQQLAIENAADYPIGSEVTLRDFYVDNLMSGAATIEQVIEIKQQTTELLLRGGFPLRKFAANDQRIIDDVEPDDREETIRFDDTEFIKTLGLKWSPTADCFLFEFKPRADASHTKRSILSNLASFFDPLGLLNPLIVSCKLIVQQLWKLRLSWDEEAPTAIRVQWEQFYNQLPLLRELKICRHVEINNDTQLHVFADASTKAYGACVYAVWATANGLQSSLVCAKSRVAPTKQITLPRLELCAALLAAELISTIVDIWDAPAANIYCWSDSTITLAWIAGEPARWNVFVANRVAKIQKLSGKFLWQHVPTELNPADLVSRGLKASEIVNNSLWWHGPQFLRQSQWPSTPASPPAEIPEERRQHTALPASVVADLVREHKYVSNYMKLIRIFAYVKRFIDGCRRQRVCTESPLISVAEVEAALLLICKHIQRVSFPDEYRRLQAGEAIDRRSKLLSLTPFMHDNVIRVGDRLSNAALPFTSKHPVLLPSSHPFVTTLIRHHRRLHLHAGAQTLQNILRERVWIINARNVIKSVIHNCVLCYRCSPIVAQQIMGDLPADRVQQSHPFEVTGIDYCGPVAVTQQIRGRSPIKTYIAVFVCFTTKAVHLELVPELTTAAFIAALKRFVARRGMCRKIYSDNATNFVGANRELRELLSAFLESEHIENVHQACLQQGIEWHFIPPRSPNFGGLWESCVKLAKHHLRRAIGTRILTQDELHTVCCQAEAIINSRPLTQMSSDPNDMRALTPAHFLVGRPLTTIPQAPVAEPPIGSLKRYQHLQYIQQQFWHRWHAEYLQQLQQRTKWKLTCQNLQPGDLVLLKDDNTPPLKWSMGRIEETTSGADGFVRVVTVKTADGLQKRAISKICKLPLDASF